MTSSSTLGMWVPEQMNVEQVPAAGSVLGALWRMPSAHSVTLPFSCSRDASYLSDCTWTDALTKSGHSCKRNQHRAPHFRAVNVRQAYRNCACDRIDIGIQVAHGGSGSTLNAPCETLACLRPSMRKALSHCCALPAA